MDTTNTLIFLAMAFLMLGLCFLAIYSRAMILWLAAIIPVVYMSVIIGHPLFYAFAVFLTVIFGIMGFGLTNFSERD